MIVLDGKIRLTAKEIISHRIDTGIQKVPLTVAEYNQQLQDAAAYWRQETGGDDPAGNLLANLLELDQVPTARGG